MTAGCRHFRSAGAVARHLSSPLAVCDAQGFINHYGVGYGLGRIPRRAVPSGAPYHQWRGDYPGRWRTRVCVRSGCGHKLKFQFLQISLPFASVSQWEVSTRGFFVLPLSLPAPLPPRFRNQGTGSDACGPAHENGYGGIGSG